MTRKCLLIAGVALLLGASMAAPIALPVYADDLQGQTKQDFIDALAPKTRGLTLSNQGTQGTQETTQQTSAAPQKDMRIQFEFGSAKLTDSAKAVLNELGAARGREQASEPWSIFDSGVVGLGRFTDRARNRLLAPSGRISCCRPRVGFYSAWTNTSAHGTGREKSSLLPRKFRSAVLAPAESPATHTTPMSKR